jgi:hypothetical protein
VKLLGRDPAGASVFRAEGSAGVWSVTRDDVFYGDYLSRAEAVSGACAAARDVEALGGTAEVRTGPEGKLVRHQQPKTRP